MNSLQVKKHKLYQERNDGNYYNIELKRDSDKTLSIFFGGNLDLYFSLENFFDNPTFIIGKDYYEIYALFDELYHSVINADIYGHITEEEINRIIFMSEEEQKDYHEAIKEELERREKSKNSLKGREPYQNLVQDNVIIWKSDEYFEEITPFVKIKKQEDTYRLEFEKPIIPDKYKNEADLMLMDPRRITIRFRNSGSRYEPFNIIFMKFYQGLCALDYEYHQIHIEEYLISERINRGQTLSRILKKQR